MSNFDRDQYDTFGSIDLDNHPELLSSPEFLKALGSFLDAFRKATGRPVQLQRPYSYSTFEFVAEVPEDVRIERAGERERERRESAERAEVARAEREQREWEAAGLLGVSLEQYREAQKKARGY